MQGLLSILSIIQDKFDKFKNTDTRMLDSSYHNMLLKVYWNLVFDVSLDCVIRYATML